MVFADAFLGGGSVALTAKAAGFGLVLANDIAARSVIVGRALLENSTVRVGSPRCYRALASRTGRVEGRRLLERLPARMAEFLAAGWAYADGLPRPKDDT